MKTLLMKDFSIYSRIVTGGQNGKEQLGYNRVGD